MNSIIDDEDKIKRVPNSPVGCWNLWCYYCAYNSNTDLCITPSKLEEYNEEKVPGD